MRKTPKQQPGAAQRGTSHQKGRHHMVVTQDVLINEERMLPSQPPDLLRQAVEANPVVQEVMRLFHARIVSIRRTTALPDAVQRQVSRQALPALHMSNPRSGRELTR